MTSLDAIWNDLTQWEASMNERDAQLARQKPIHNQVHTTCCLRVNSKRQLEKLTECSLETTTCA